MADTSDDWEEGVGVFPTIPPKVGADPLVLALLHALVFLEGSSDDIVERDAADEAVEQMAAYLRRLSPQQKADFQQSLQRLIEYARDEHWDDDQILYLKEFFENYGIE
ncbi:MAG: hypothetical protein KatS3mg105_2874 [Gemmatales bacterium]|nr:MAG: hypothetical protein KatS3mg105_2874 [Gemmatales bacterium]